MRSVEKKKKRKKRRVEKDMPRFYDETRSCHPEQALSFLLGFVDKRNTHHQDGKVADKIFCHIVELRTRLARALVRQLFLVCQFLVSWGRTDPKVSEPALNLNMTLNLTLTQA